MDMGFADEAIAAFYKALKPGGILGVEDHRARADKPQDPKAESGYVRQDYAIQLIEKAGFKLWALRRSTPIRKIRPTARSGACRRPSR